jgi:UDP-glucose 4-epimerase
MTSKPHILITGGAGYVGSRLARRLVAEGKTSVTVIDNLRRGSVDSLSTVRDSIRFAEADVRDGDALHELTKGVDVVFHFAAESAVMAADADPEYCFETNVTGTFRVLRAARINGVRRVVFSSSREVYGDAVTIPVPETAPLQPKNAYGSSKAAAEMCCRPFVADGLDVSIARLSNVYGPGDRGRVIPRFVEDALLGLPLTLFGAEQLIDFVWIETVLDAMMRLGFGPSISWPINVGSGKGVTILELCERVVRATASPSPVEIVASRGVEVVRFVADTSAAQKWLGLSAPPDPLFGLDEVVNAARMGSEAGQSMETAGLKSSTQPTRVRSSISLGRISRRPPKWCCRHNADKFSFRAAYRSNSPFICIYE